MGDLTPSTLELVGAAGVLLAALGVGTTAHELAHVAVLRALGVPSEVTVFPRRGAPAELDHGVSRPLATVTPRAAPGSVTAGKLRLAAIAPLALATPLVLVLLGVLPDPLASGDRFLAAATVGWFGCALPSPQDFSLFWHPERAFDGGAGSEGPA